MAAKLEKTLVMIFKSKDNSNASVTLSGVKDGITQTEVKACMDTIITNNVFTLGGGDLVAKVSAKVIDKTTTPHEF